MPSPSSASASVRASHISRHEQYYLRGGDVKFLVDGVQFRLHSHFFERESDFFRNLLMGPTSPGHDEDRLDNGDYRLDDVTSDDFATFLWVFYNPVYHMDDRDQNDWVVILRLADKWGFNNIKELATRRLETKDMDEVVRVGYYQDYGVAPQYHIRHLAVLITRELPLTIEEGEKLGIKTAMRIARARETARAEKKDGLRTPTTATLDDDEMKNVVYSIFGFEQPPEPTPPKPEEGDATTKEQPEPGYHLPKANGAGPKGSAFRMARPSPHVDTSVNVLAAQASTPVSARPPTSFKRGGR